MVRKIKVYAADIDGLHDWIVGAPNQADALAAFGVNQDLFQQGRAFPTDDAGADEAALAMPGVPLRRLKGSRAAFQPIGAGGAGSWDKAAKAAGLKARRKAPKAKVDRSRLDQAEAALAAFEGEAKIGMDDGALAALLKALDARGYDFVTPTPATHARVIARRKIARPGNLRDVLGWSLPFDSLERGIADLLVRAGAIEDVGGLRRAKVRVSRLSGNLFLHSAYPTDDKDAIFFGPDSYRFADFILRETGGPARRIVDIGAGAGVGAIVAAASHPGARLTLTDLNAKALALAKVNAGHAGLAVECVQTNALEAVEGEIDLILANPPYMVDEYERTYRDGGGLLGAELSAAWARQAVARLGSGGRMLLYSGSAIVDGQDGLRAALDAIPGVRVDYREIDPDVFGEELEKPAYAQADRIAIVGAVLTKL